MTIDLSLARDALLEHFNSIDELDAVSREISNRKQEIRNSTPYSGLMPVVGEIWHHVGCRHWHLITEVSNPPGRKDAIRVSFLEAGIGRESMYVEQFDYYTMRNTEPLGHLISSDDVPEFVTLMFKAWSLQK